MNMEVHSHSRECSLQFCIAPMQDGRVRTTCGIWRTLPRPRT